MADESCYNVLRNSEMFQGIKDKELKAIVDAIDEIKSKAETRGYSFEAEMMKTLDKMKLDTQNRQLEILLQAKKLKENVNTVSQDFFRMKDEENIIDMAFFNGERRTEGIIAILNGVQTTAKGAVDSVYNRIEYLRESNTGRYHQKLISSLERKDLEIYKTGQLDREIYMEMDRLQNPESKIAPSTNETVRKIAEVNVWMNGVMKADRTMGMGHTYGSLAYITKQVHDRAAVRGDGSKDAMNAWIDAILPRLNKAETFGTLAMNDVAAQRQQLEASWKHIIYGEGQDEVQRRSLHFIDGENAFEYNEAFGNKNLYESMTSRIADNARIVGQQMKLGPNPREGLDKLIERTRKSLREHPEELAKFNDRGVPKIENIWKELTGYTAIPGDSLMASAGKFSRNLNNLTYLSNTGVRALAGNIPVSAMEIKSQLGLNYLETGNAAIKLLASRVQGELRKETMLKAGMAMQDYHFGLASQFTDDIAPGKASAAIIRMFEGMSQGMGTDTYLGRAAGNMGREIKTKGLMGASQAPFFKMTGLTLINDIDRAASARLLMNGVFNQVGKDFNDLAPQFKANIERANIGEAEWKIMQMAIDRLETNKMEVVTPEKIREMSPEVAAQIMQEHGIKGMHPSEFLRDTEMKYGAYLWSSGRIATTTPDARTAALIKGGTKEDHIEGQVRRLLGQFKSFSLFQSDIMTRFLTADPQAGARELSDLIRGKGSIGALGAYVASAALFWYMGEQLIRMGQGREPLGTGPDDFSKALLKSGAFGFMADFVDAEQGRGKDRSIPAYLMGPSFGRGINAFRLGLQGAQGESIGKEAGSFVQNMIPGQNFAVTRRAVEPFILDPIREMLDPGYAYKKKYNYLTGDAK